MAQFLPVPANDKVVSVAGFIQSRKTRSWKMSEKLSVTIKLSRYGAKIVTSLLPQPSVLWLVLELKLSRYYEIVMIKKFVLVSNPGGRAGVVQCYKFVKITSLYG